MIQLGDVVKYKFQGRPAPLLVQSVWLDSKGKRRLSGVMFDLDPVNIPLYTCQAVHSAVEGDGEGQWQERTVDSLTPSGSTETPSGSST